MGRSRPKLTLWIESCCDGYFDLVYERWWGGALHPWVILAIAVMLLKSRLQVWWWVMGGLLLVLAGLLMVRRREQEVIRRVERQICVECGYDLRASLDCCPECGTPVPMRNLRRLGL